jgi:hypothetical protein
MAIRLTMVIRLKKINKCLPVMCKKVLVQFQYPQFILDLGLRTIVLQKKQTNNNRKAWIVAIVY